MTKSVRDQLDLYCHVPNQNLLLFVLLLDTVFLSVVVILLMVEMYVVFLCSHFNWQFDDFVCDDVSFNSYKFLHKFYSRVENDDWSAAQLLAKILCIRDDDFRVGLLFSDGGSLLTSELNSILS